MSLVAEARTAMQSVYQQTSQDASQVPPANSVAGRSQGLLEAVLRVSQEWVERLPVHDPEREAAIRLAMLTEDLVRTGDRSPRALSHVRSLLCSNCRRLNAAQGKCSGQALDRCLLLNGPGP